MTARLYYDDPYLTDFRAQVLERRPSGAQFAVILDQTAFYPTSGGQPSDGGTLGDARVLHVEEDESGGIIHYLDAEIPQGIVAGRVDWERRFDHMQQHSGQHILSQAFLRVAQAQTVGFHLGEALSTIDVTLPDAFPALIREAEERATRIAFEDRPVRILKVEKEELKDLGIRKETDREGTIRVIDIEGFDRSACGGTHVRRTGEVGVIAVSGFERYKGGTRVEFVCGGRAAREYRKDHSTLQQLARLFTASPGELPQLAQKLLLEKSELQRENHRLQDRVLEMEAEESLRAADKMGWISCVRKIYVDRKFDSVKILAHKLASRPGVLAILAVGGETPQLAVARSQDVPGDCGTAVKEAAAQLGGRGGGRPDLAQAGGMPAAALDGWLEALERYFRARAPSQR